MALIKKFTERPDARCSFRSEVECGYKLGSFEGRRILHLETYGSSSREIPGKVSQSLELDEQGARELIEIVRRAFPNID